MDVLALLAVGVIAALWWLVSRDDENYEIRRGWRLPKGRKWK